MEKPRYRGWMSRANLKVSNEEPKVTQKQYGEVLRQRAIGRFKSTSFHKFHRKALSRYNMPITGPIDDECDFEYEQTTNQIEDPTDSPIPDNNAEQQHPKRVHQDHKHLSGLASLFAICECGDKAAVKRCLARIGTRALLVYNRTKFTGNCLNHACWHANASAVEVLLNGLKHLPIGVEERQLALGNALLMTSRSRKGTAVERVRVVQSLVSAGVNLHFTDLVGDTCLHMLVREPAQPLLVKHIITNSPHGMTLLRCRNWRGRTALDVALHTQKVVYGEGVERDYSVQQVITFLDLAKVSKTRLKVHETDARLQNLNQQTEHNCLSTSKELIALLSLSARDAISCCESYLTQIEDHRLEQQQKFVSEAIAKSKHSIQQSLLDPTFVQSDPEYRRIQRIMKARARSGKHVKEDGGQQDIIEPQDVIEKYTEVVMNKAREQATQMFLKSNPVINIEKELSTLGTTMPTTK